MIVSSIVTIKIAYALSKDMVNLEVARMLAPNLIESSTRWLSDRIQQHRSYQQVVSSDGKTGENDQGPVSTEYLVHNWLEALFAWFQIIILWHEPSVSIGAVTGLLSSFLFLTYFAPRFYATVFIAIFVFNLYKFWFRHVWPEIRVPPGRDREEELRLDVDRWTYLHPQLMTLAELSQHAENLMKLVEKYLYDLLELRQRKPIAFCSKLCLIFVCTAIIGNTLSGMCLIFLALTTLMTAPGIYVHLLPEDSKNWLRQTVGQMLANGLKSDDSNTLHHQVIERGEHVLPDSTSGMTSKMPKEFIASSLSSTTKSIEQLFETLKQKSFPLMRTERRSSSPQESDADTCDERTKLISASPEPSRNSHITTESLDDPGADSESQQDAVTSERKSSSNSLNGNEESVSLLESDEDQLDGFVML